jgi:uncharacterized membrane protein YgdD (TMEM256/DUF423 family)
MPEAMDAPASTAAGVSAAAAGAVAPSDARQQAQRWLTAGAVLGGLAVILGAFGAHGVKQRVSAEQLSWFELGARYALLHAPAVLAVGGVVAWRGPSRAASVSGWGFLVGTVIFSGTLIAMGLGGPRWLGAITPLGGLSLIVAWFGLALAARR